MTPRRSTKRAVRKDATLAIVRNGGRKAIKDADLASRFGVTLGAFYRRLGDKLLLLPRQSMFRLAPKKSRGTASTPSALCFTQSGVILVAALFGGKRALQAGVEVALGLKTRRRSSKQKQRRPRRADDPDRAAAYDQALARLHAQMSKIVDS